MKHHEPFIHRCYELANQAAAKGNHPFGALLVLDGEIIQEAENTVSADNDPTRHAELNLLHLMADLPLSADDIAKVILYTSTEPCIMCSGALYWSGISTVVYGCSESALAKYGGHDFLTSCEETFAKGNRKITVVGPVLLEEGEAVHKNYW